MEAHPISADKPLPSRPIVSLANDPSPSKDSRSLVDASERPLRLSIAGSECDWPTLLPTSHSTPVLGSSTPQCAMIDTPSPSGRRSVSAASLMAAPTDLPSTTEHPQSDADPESPGNTVPRKSSSSSSLVSYSGAKQTAERAVTTPVQGYVTESAQRIGSPYPPRKSSLGVCVGHDNLMERAQSTKAAITGPSDFTRDTNEESRPHSPSPASFSRPRPTSISHSPGVMSVTSAVAFTPVRSQKTASRIPLADQKKATLVDIKARQASGIPLPKLERGLSFGGRRIDSPDPLKVLDHGIRRRQLQRANTNGSDSTVSTVPTRLITDDVLPAERSKINTPESTMGSSTEDEEEITTPSDKSLPCVKHGYKPKHTKGASTTYHGAQAFKIHDDAEVILARPPPSNSPFTGPLQTIPSQSMLPVLAASEDGSIGYSTSPKVVIKPTEFSAFAKRLSVLEDAQAIGSEDNHDRLDLIDVRTRSELAEILREAKSEDALISQSGAEGLDDETKLGITRTLSILEGKGGPPDAAADLEHLSRLFGRLKSGFERAPKSAAFVEDATVADRFLATQDAASEHTHHIGEAGTNDHFETPAAKCRRESTNSLISIGKISKWSNSTASIKHQALPFAEGSSTQSIFRLEVEGHPPGLPPKDLPTEMPVSIGYPSRTAGKAHRVLGADERSITHQKSAARRESSPTLGARVPGSVKAAREKARDAAGSRATKASNTKMDKMPTSNTRAFSISGDFSRGRNPYAESPTQVNRIKVGIQVTNFNFAKANIVSSALGHAPKVVICSTRSMDSSPENATDATAISHLSLRSKTFLPASSFHPSRASTHWAALF